MSTTAAFSRSKLVDGLVSGKYSHPQEEGDDDQNEVDLLQHQQLFEGVFAVFYLFVLTYKRSDEDCIPIELSKIQ